MARCETRPACKSMDELMAPLHLAQCAKCHRPIHKAHIDQHMQQCNSQNQMRPRASDVRNAAEQVCVPDSRQAANDTFSLASPQEREASPSLVSKSGIHELMSYLRVYMLMWMLGGTFPALLPMHELKALAFTPMSRPHLHTALQLEATRQILFGQSTVAKREVPKSKTPPTPKRQRVVTPTTTKPDKAAVPVAKLAAPASKPVTLTSQAKIGVSTKVAIKAPAKCGKKSSSRPQKAPATIAPASAGRPKKAQTQSPKVVRVPPSAPLKAVPSSKVAKPRSVGRVVPPPLLAFPKHLGFLPPPPVGILPRLASPTMPHKKTIPRTTFSPELHRAYTELPSLLSWSQDDPDMIQMPPSLAASSPTTTPSSRSSDLLLQALLLQDT